MARILAAVYSDVVRQKSKDRVTTATAMAIELPDLHFSERAIIRGTKDWVEALRNELQVTRRTLNLLTQKQLHQEKGRRTGAKKYIFNHGIKGVRRVMHKHGTVLTLQQIGMGVPDGSQTGLRWVPRTRRMLTWNMWPSSYNHVIIHMQIKNYSI